jgi:hypothetical protein
MLVKSGGMHREYKLGVSLSVLLSSASNHPVYFTTIASHLLYCKRSRLRPVQQTSHINYLPNNSLDDLQTSTHLKEHKEPRHQNASSSKILPPNLRRFPRYVSSPFFPQSLLTRFPVAGITYTTVVATKEGAAVDGARTRWQHQHASARHVLSGGMSLQDLSEGKH